MNRNLIQKLKVSFGSLVSPRHCSPSQQELYDIPYFLCDFNDLKVYKKLSVSCIIIYMKRF